MCAMSLATWLRFTGVHARCVVLRVQCPWPLGYCSPVLSLAVLCCLCGVPGHLAPAHPCARLLCRAARVVSLASWLLFTAVYVRCVVLRVRCLGPLGSRSPVCTLGVLCCLCGVLGHLPLAHQCARSVCCVCSVLGNVAAVDQRARSVCCVACVVSLASWLPFTSVRARRVVLRVRCPWPLGSGSPVCTLGVLCCVCGVLGHLAPVNRCARSVCGECSALGLLAPVHRCIPSVCCVACAVSLPSWRRFTGAHGRLVSLRVQCPWPLGSDSPCKLSVLCCVSGVLGLLAAVHWCAR